MPKIFKQKKTAMHTIEIKVDIMAVLLVLFPYKDMSECTSLCFVTKI
ncbi:membrane protein [Bacillus subtilis]|nr:hypothetical protein BSSC8_31640 [Bacillus subtilis subsp. subtilis str. SC-8]QHF57091.1 membrane protein [Bacillus subtilis]BAO93327.1 hypothetical protein BSNT_07596 [Bacillus subtilis subsp. natto BEST195]